MNKRRDWVEDAEALLEMGAVMVDADTVRGLLCIIKELKDYIDRNTIANTEE